MAECKSTDITIGGVAEYAKENIAIGIVILDLLLAYWFWISILMVRPLEKLATEEIA